MKRKKLVLVVTSALLAGALALPAAAQVRGKCVYNCGTPSSAAAPSRSSPGSYGVPSGVGGAAYNAGHALGRAIGNALFGGGGDGGAAAAAAAARREAERLERERLIREAAERKRQEEEERHRRITAGLRGADGIGELQLRREAIFGSSSALDQLRGVAEHETTAAGLAAANAPAELVRAEAAQPYDLGARALAPLPDAPATVEARVVAVRSLDDLGKLGEMPKEQASGVLEGARQAYGEAETATKQEIARLEREPVRDEARLREERDRLRQIEHEQRKVEDLQKKVDHAKDGELVNLGIEQGEVSAEIGKPQ